MADEVLGPTLLCEAMEYLSKLAKNLGLRTETMKEKRINKSKLKNMRSVKTAAEKVLLLCDLSKKSIENVENSVKGLIQESSAYSGGKFEKSSSTTTRKIDSKNRQPYKRIVISGKKYDIKIPRNISLKHYMSVNVMAKSMPITILNKYPVYKHCKLYYSRKNRDRKRNESKTSKDASSKQQLEGKDKSNGFYPHTKSDTCEATVSRAINKNEGGTDDLLSDTENMDRNCYKTASKIGSVDRCTNKSVILEEEDKNVTNKNLNRLEEEDENVANKNIDRLSPVHTSEIQDSSDENQQFIKKGKKKNVIEDSDSESNSKCRDSPKNLVETSEEQLSSVGNSANQHSTKKGKKSFCDNSDNENNSKSEKIPKKRVDSSEIQHSSDEISQTQDSIKIGKKKNVNDDLHIERNSRHKDSSMKQVETCATQHSSDVISKNQHSLVKGKKKNSSDDSDTESNSKQRDLGKKHKTSLSGDETRHSHKLGKKRTSMTLLSDSDDENIIASEVKPMECNVIELDSDLEEKTATNSDDVNGKSKAVQSETAKPLIKCVNISKLLKPDVAVKYESKKSIKPNPKNILVMSRRGELMCKPNLHPKASKKAGHENRKSCKANNSANTSLQGDIKNQEYEDFWAPKRKEVKCFVPKKLSITIEKLPLNFTTNFLLKSNLVRITQNSAVICEVSLEKDVRSENSSEFHKEEIISELVQAKNVLLNDSDEDEVQGQSFPAENEQVKKTLLNKSESESNETEKEITAVEAQTHNKEVQSKSGSRSPSTVDEPKISAENEILSKDSAKSALLNDSGQSFLAENEQVKKTLLNESESESNGIEKEITAVEAQTRNKEEKTKSGSRSPSTVDKPKLSSENEIQSKNSAKSALLNDSSGSKSDDSLNKTHSIKSSRRKNIMESMHAKKMLLTYSSSSETEDEQLKNVLKEIKESLIKDIASDEEKAKHDVRKKMLSTPDSEEEEIALNRNKRRKLNESEESLNKDLDNSRNSSSESPNRTNPEKMGRSSENPDESSSHNTDQQDDKEIERLVELSSLNKPRRARGESALSAKSRSNMSRTPLIKGQAGLLEVDLPSDDDASASANDTDNADEEEELPTVDLSGLNGGSPLEHLAKDDLLGESESDSSKDKSSDNVKKEDDSEIEKIKSKRRKPNAISSDSEAGSSRKPKEKTGSDFEDSEEESSEPAKKNKRKKKIESDESDDSSNEEGKKKRRRIKQVDDSEGSGSDTETEGKSKHGRKNIRKVMGKNQLEEATKKAARQEKERLARIAERQKMYNNMAFDESGKPDEVVLDKVILDFDPETKEPLIEVDRGLVKKLKPHQANGIKFMWDACFESVKRIKKDKGSGCILAHCMGLGKTLQVVSLTHTLLIHSELTQVNRVLVVCPLSTVLNWVNEFKMWLKFAHADYEVDVYELSRHKQNAERAYQLSQWFLHGGVCVLGYEMFRNLSADNVKKFKKKMLRQLQEALVDPGPDLVVCDEGHLLKNEKTSLSQSMNRVKTLRRIVLTGTPLQNNLKEYYCMVQFVKPNLLGKYNEYLNRFVNPITNGQYTDSTEHDIRVMKRRSHVLHKMLDGAVQRRDYGVLAPFLPPKHEYVLFITLNEVQIKLYQHYLDNYSRRPLPGKSSGFLFPDFQSLQRIWTHPLVLKYNSERYEIMQQKKREREEEDSEGSLVDFIDDDSTPDESSSEEESDSLSDLSDDSRKKSKKKKSSKKSKTKENKGSSRRGTRANPMELDDEPLPDIMEVKNDNPTEWWIPLVTEDEIEDMKNSHKLVLLFEILRQCEAIGDKLLVFSQSLYSLDLIEHFLGRVDEATQEGRVDDKLGGHVGSWSPGIDYFRLDGSTSCENRSIWCKNFNREDNPRARLFLISTRAGGLGINLVAANRVVIFDVSWNPSHDVQSIFRVYRFGQKKPCYVYRFLAMGTMEEKIYERQVTKQAISKRVIDEQQIDRHYKENDLAELYKFEPHPPAPRPVPLVPKDRLFAEMLKDHEALIYKFHEHDSLLENKEEETLSEEERKAAWEDFENEKNRPPPTTFPTWPMHNGMVPNLLAQQQQQLAYAALAQMLRKDMPNITDDSIRSMLPLIYGANPGLMQKLSDIYKYTQPGMMNPAMMNPVMNAGGQGGMGGSSGLQYEPPWQRQQQQQQQMRLQQMMQHQNQMGAKFYAGGLGSRDPIAMALQQQRAREIMVGGAAQGPGAPTPPPGGATATATAAGRPRGRPPLQQPADIVNLDSD